MPLDEVEMIVPDEEYALVISTMCASFGLPSSFADGLPVITSGMGRAAHFLLNWLESGYQVRQLVSMLQQQLITFSDRDQGITNSDCIRALEKSGIGWGKERYIKLLVAGHVRSQGDSDEKPEERERTEQQQRDDEIKKHLTNLMGELFPDEAALSSPKGIWGWLVNILDRFGVCGTEEDAIVLQEMKGIAKELQECPVPDSMPFQQMFLYARDMLQELRVGVQRLPKPGFLYISSLSNGGISGRKHTFLLGMDEQSWSGNIRQNPMLLDEECRRIGAGLQTAVQRQRDRQRLRDGRFGMISGNITFSFSSYDLAEGATASPAFQLLQVFRKVSGETNADYEMLHRSLGEPVGYLDVEQPSSTELNGLPLDGSHYVFRQIHANVNLMRDRQSFIESVYPSLRQGRLALEARGSSQVTEHDGYIAGDEWTDDWKGRDERTLSASQLEKYAECPMRYFFQYVLRIRVKDQVTFDRTSWLKPNERGSLLHEVYRRYMTEVNASKVIPITHDYARLLRIAEETILLYAERIPAPSLMCLRGNGKRCSGMWTCSIAWNCRLRRLPGFSNKSSSWTASRCTLSLARTWRLRCAGSSTGSIKLRRINIGLSTIRPAVLGLTRKMACSQAVRSCNTRFTQWGRSYGCGKRVWILMQKCLKRLTSFQANGGTGK